MKSSKIIVIFIVLLLLFGVTSLANENYEINYENQYEFNYDTHNQGINVENDELFNYLLEQSKAHNELINVLDYQIAASDAKAVLTKFFLNEEVYYISSAVAESYENDYLKEIRISYTLSQDEISSYEQQLNTVLQEYLSGVNEQWSDIEKVIYTNIFLCKKVDSGNQNDYASHTIIGALINKKAISDGYAKAFKYLLNKINGNASIVTSNTSETAWNMVEIDGTYYHVDSFSNDIQGHGKTMYEYIIKSDTYMRDNMGLEWVSDYVSEPEEDYDADWLYADSYLEYKDGYWYYLYNNLDCIELDRFDFSTGEVTYGDPIEGILEEPLTWSPGFTSDGKNFYASTNKEIYIINFDFDTGEASYEKYFTLEDDQKLIYSIEYLDGKMYYDTTVIDSDGFTTEDTKESNVYIKLLEISSDETEISIEPNATYDLKIIKNPVDATENVTWESLDENIVIVDENGKIQGVKAGNTQVTATFGTQQIVYNVTVTAGEDPKPVEPLEITTLAVENVEEYKVIIFNRQTTIESIINSENFPILSDSTYSITVLDKDGNLKDNWTEFIGSKNTIIVSKDGETKAEFKAVVQGDVTGNGILRMYDAFQLLKDVIVGVNLDCLDCIIRDHASSGDRIVRMYDAFQYLKEAILS